MDTQHDDRSCGHPSKQKEDGDVLGLPARPGQRRSASIHWASALVAVAAALALWSCQQTTDQDMARIQSVSRAYGEPVNTFPSWSERMGHVMVNRARADPVTDLANCSNCADAHCFTHPLPPMQWDERLSHSSRFHAANLTKSNCGMMHPSPCQLVSTIGNDYPNQCDGSPSCACQGGTASCSGGTDVGSRLALFGVNGFGWGENIAPNGDPISIFYMWLHESTSDSTCQWSMSNGHRWNILGDFQRIGVGAFGGYTVQDFASGNLTEKIPAGAHYPQTGTSIDFRANWYDTAAPNSAMVNLGGACHAMTVERGSGGNATYIYSATVSQSCQNYYFVFHDSADHVVTYPTTGSFGVNCSQDWSSARPAMGNGCQCQPNCSGRQCGDDGCGGSCGTCASLHTCNSSGQCVCNQGLTDCGGQCVDLNTDHANCGGCGSPCQANETCQSGHCNATQIDAGTSVDSGTTADSGITIDSGPRPDGAVVGDGSNSGDGTMAADGSTSHDGGTSHDGDTSHDGGTNQKSSIEGGCNCRASGTGSGPGLWLLLFAFGLALGRRRRT